MFARLITSTGNVLALACSTASLALAGGWAPPSGRNFDGRSPDTKDAAAAAHSARTSASTHSSATTPDPRLTGKFDGRSPDTKDAAAAAHASAPVVVVGSAGFDWTDAGIGAAAGFGLAVMLVAGLTLTRTRMSVVSPS